MSISVSFCMFMFGLVMVCQGLVQNWGGLMATRFFLGTFETGMFPGCMSHQPARLPDVGILPFLTSVGN
jgi:hypothetical protein